MSTEPTDTTTARAPQSAAANYRRLAGKAIEDGTRPARDVARQHLRGIRAVDPDLAYLLDAETAAATRVHQDIEDAWSSLDQHLAELIAARAAVAAHLAR